VEKKMVPSSLAGVEFTGDGEMMCLAMLNFGL
jgi:hypothetical protein